MPEQQDLVQRLRQLGAGYDEWRVQNPENGNYCMARDRRDAFNPEGELREWLEDHRRRFPDSMYAGYEVAKVHVMTQDDKAMLAAADEIERLRGEARVRDDLLGEALAVLEPLAAEDSEDPARLRALVGQIKAARAPKPAAGLLEGCERG